MILTANIFIPAGTKVLRDDSVLVETLGPCFIDGAYRAPDGGYIYTVGPQRFYASAGTVVVIPTADERPAMARIAHS